MIVVTMQHLNYQTSASLVMSLPFKGFAKHSKRSFSVLPHPISSLSDRWSGALVLLACSSISLSARLSPSLRGGRGAF